MEGTIWLSLQSQHMVFFCFQLSEASEYEADDAPKASKAAGGTEELICGYMRLPTKARTFRLFLEAVRVTYTNCIWMIPAILASRHALWSRMRSKSAAQHPESNTAKEP